VRQRPPSSRPAIPFLLCASLTVALVAACTTAGGGVRPSSAALPGGLVGPVAPTVGPQALRYVALGDTYTFGDGVRQVDRWPNQLVRLLRPAIDLDLVANLSARSVASQDVIDEQLPDLRELEPRLVSVQVGANDAVFDTPPADYEANMRRILDTVLASVGPERVVLVTTPDFTLVGDYNVADDAEALSARVAELNEVATRVAAERGVSVVDITPIADRVTFDASLVASDGEHPSAKQYSGWADLVATAVRRMFKDHPSAPSSQDPESVEMLVDATPEASPEWSAGPPASPILISS
jgi:lysophospholipase L1-like esterase